MKRTEEQMVSATRRGNCRNKYASNPLGTWTSVCECFVSAGVRATLQEKIRRAVTDGLEGKWCANKSIGERHGGHGLNNQVIPLSNQTNVSSHLVVLDAMRSVFVPELRTFLILSIFSSRSTTTAPSPMNGTEGGFAKTLRQ